MQALVLIILDSIELKFLDFSEQKDECLQTQRQSCSVLASIGRKSLFSQRPCDLDFLDGFLRLFPVSFDVTQHCGPFFTVQVPVISRRGIVRSRKRVTPLKPEEISETLPLDSTAQIVISFRLFPPQLLYGQIVTSRSLNIRSLSSIKSAPKRNPLMFQTQLLSNRSKTNPHGHLKEDKHKNAILLVDLLQLSESSQTNSVVQGSLIQHKYKECYRLHPGSNLHPEMNRLIQRQFRERQAWSSRILKRWLLSRRQGQALSFQRFHRLLFIRFQIEQLPQI